MKTNIFAKRYEKLGHKVIKPEYQRSLRVNTLKTTPEEFESRMTKKRIKLERIEWLDLGYYYKSFFSLGATPEYLMGYYFLQDAIAQLSVELMDIVPGESVLDMTAAPGAKTTQIAQYMENKGLLVAVENKKRRVEALKNNIQRMSATNTVVYDMNAADVEQLGVQFDKVLLDAPCSGNYFTDSEWFEKRDLEGIQRNAKLQRKLLKAAYDVLKPNGILLYSTCSLEPEENEMNIQWFMDNFNCKLEKVETTMGVKGLTTVFNNKLRPVISKTRRFWPGETQGFFIAKIRKTE